MTKKEKITGNLAGYAGIFLLIVAFVFAVLSISTGFSFKGDVFVMLMICGIFEGCRETYVEFRNKEDAEWENTKQKSKRIITVTATYDLSELDGCKITPKDDVKRMVQEEMEDIFAEDEGYESVKVKVEDKE